MAELTQSPAKVQKNDRDDPGLSSEAVLVPETPSLHPDVPGTLPADTAYNAADAVPDTAASTIGASPTENQVSEPPRLEPEAAVPAAVQPRYITLTTALVITAAGSLFSFLMATFFILVLLGLTNRGLQYATPQDINYVNGQMSVLELQSQDLSGNLSGLQTRLTAVEGLSSRLSDLEKELLTANARAETMERNITELQGSLTASSTRLDRAAKDIEEAGLKIDALITRYQRFQNFLNGLGELINDLNQVP